ncbi:Trihelix transcription factor [Actinidia chinensis var. chinensis]|uniref:Trihelix transcription factor n=1 Tax=Actinidia chinensis var. chinensis TaxID=1590841 RepID=A0A2R6P6T7_ACTCC|nr:Trihelix transcription factor [Actinidia chinensis var. chinensis]
MASPTSPPPPPTPVSPPQDPDQNPSHHSSPSPTPPSPPTPTPPNPSSPLPLRSTIPTSPAKKPQPLPWSHQETVNLIEAYQEKWYSLKRGPLKSSQWEEVAVTVAARCGYEEPSKTAVQCRHKIEKLRKRYRAEKQRPNPHAWDFFSLMHRLDHGPLPISAQPMALIRYPKTNPKHGGSGSGDDDNDNSDKRSRSKSSTRILRGHVSKNKAPTNQKLGGGDWGLGLLGKRSARTRPERFERYKSESEVEEEEEEEEEEDVVVGGGGGGGGGMGVVAELAAEIKAFAERFVRMENKKLEMMRETERYRMEMENKRMEMILESQRKIVDTIGRAFGSHKKMKTGQDI